MTRFGDSLVMSSVAETLAMMAVIAPPLEMSLKKSKNRPLESIVCRSKSITPLEVIVRVSPVVAVQREPNTTLSCPVAVVVVVAADKAEEDGGREVWGGNLESEEEDENSLVTRTRMQLMPKLVCVSIKATTAVELSMRVLLR